MRKPLFVMLVCGAVGASSMTASVLGPWIMDWPSWAYFSLMAGLVSLTSAFIAIVAMGEVMDPEPDYRDLNDAYGPDDRE